MNFLKSVLSSSGVFPGYTIQDKINVSDNSIFTLHNATDKETGLACSVHVFELAKAPTLLPLARNYLTRLRTFKHPGVVKFLNSLETDNFIYIATERVSPLQHTLLKEPSREVLFWGLYSIAQTVAFINTEAASVHGSIQTSSIFCTEAGEWKLAGFEILTCMKDDDPFLLRYGNLLPQISNITPPELASKGFRELKNINSASLDSWQFGCLIYTCFNGGYSSISALQNQGKIPNIMFAQYRRLLSPSSQARLPISNFLDFGRRPGSFFQSDLILISDALPSLSLQSKSDVEAFLSENAKVIATLPSGFTKNKLLPEMVRSFEFGNGGAAALSAVLSITKDLAPSDIETLVVPVLLRIWASKDRSKQLVLLENLKEYIQFFTTKQINDSLFPHIGSSFTDPAPIMRETAIRQVMILVPYLTERNINGDLLKHLAKTANDQQPGIRTNTTICLGKIASHMGINNKRKVLTAAFSRSLKDPFVHARLASLQAIAATADAFEKEDLANRLMPGVVPLLIDAEGDVRKQARKTLDQLLVQLDDLTKDMPETLEPSTGTAVQVNSQAKPTGGAVESAGIWAGWAISTLSRNIDSSSPAPSQVVTSTAATPTITPDGSRTSTPTLAAQANHSTRPMSTRAGSGLKLQSKTKVDLSSIYAEDFGTGGDAWGTDEWDDPVPLIDNASATKRLTSKKPASSTSSLSTSLAKPLAKDTTKVKKEVKKDKPVVTQEESDDAGEWDTSAW